ncbi:hypothetical protein [Streptomyces zagrosensis]|uniref:AcrR family transcriptional regulator n=1 Tax=Streptomyces zagrosensis TaxID=1042984 RepID=A0A7W9Q887_9ACTN|nr:hypothetical protein [Streptomyces zagrosensis]MBB5935331.1 AcrR family transcriptional regulator [Streptomyces zagrosensis]
MPGSEAAPESGALAGQLGMRELADRLGAHATSPYWHMATKDDVLDLAV